jgi:5-methylcytosine-specific restriction endonuclease McrA
VKWNRRSYGKERWRLVTRLMQRDGSRCSICDEPLVRHKDHDADDYITFDHIVPTSKGGTTTPDNLRLAHQRCNKKRGNQMVEPFQREAIP